MPIRPEERDRYPKDWRAISARTREAAGHRCQWCRAPRGLIMRGEEADAGTYMVETGEVYDDTTGEFRGIARGSEYSGRFVKVIITVAHLDHAPENVDPANLVALCQKCHLTYDAKHHATNAARTRRARKASADLFDGGSHD